MIHLLGARGSGALQDLLATRTLLAFDYDGTLAPLRRGTVETWLRPSTRRLWVELSARRPCAVISGRGLDDLRDRMTGAGRSILVGNHGMEVEGSRPRAAWGTRMRQWVRWLEPRLAPIPGVILEPKRFSLSIHWRGAPPAARVTRRVQRLAVQLQGARLIGGKQVINVVPRGAPNKGDALRQLMRRLRCPHALYAGDDITDEDAFVLGMRAGILGVRVGQRRTTRAPFFLRDQAEVDTLLQRLIEASPAGTKARGWRPPARATSQRKQGRARPG